MTVRWLLVEASRVPADRGWLSPEEGRKAASLRFEKRRSDWLVGRWAAKHALADRLGVAPRPEELGRFEIRNDSEGAPSALRDGRAFAAALSISHRDGAGLCAVAAPGSAIGCDLEVVEPRDDAFVADYFDVAERARVDAARGPDRLMQIALVWSAKESALKALGTGLRRDTRELHVEYGPIAPEGAWRPLRVRLPDAEPFVGWWRNSGARLITLVARPASDAPEQIPPPRQEARNSAARSATLFA